MREERTASQIKKEALEQIRENEGCRQKVTDLPMHTSAVSANFTFQRVVSEPLTVEEESWINLVRERLQQKYTLVSE